MSSIQFGRSEYTGWETVRTRLRPKDIISKLVNFLGVKLIMMSLIIYKKFIKIIIINAENVNINLFIDAQGFFFSYFSATLTTLVLL